MADLFPLRLRAGGILVMALLASLASGCCTPLAVSGRYSDEDITCAGQEGVVAHRPGVPVLAWPQLPWPERLSRAHWRGKSSAWRDNFRELLEPEPAPPLKPPHPRFHPLPTQPVFTPRLEYAPPELLGVDPHAPQERGTALPAPRPEEIPIPLPETSEPTWRDLPPPRPLPGPPQEVDESSPAAGVTEAEP